MGFFTRLKQEVWKVIRMFLFLAIILSVILTIIYYSKKIKQPGEISVLIDTDSGNEIDDLYAVTLALIDPRINITGLNSAQWNIHPRGGDSSVYESQRINEKLLLLHGKQDIPHPLGANDQCGYWGDTKPIPSAAADLIIRQAHSLGFGEKLNVITLGAVTNLATAIMMDTTLIPRIRWYAMALKYDDKRRIWDKNEFNVRNDLDGMDYLLNRAGLETHIMTATTSRNYTFDRRETFDLLRGKGPEWDYLVDRWQKIAPDNQTWIMWDMSVIHAIMHPEMVTEKEVSTPPENVQRKIFVYTWLDAKKMHHEFRKLVRRKMGEIAAEKEGNDIKKKKGLFHRNR